MKKLLLALPVAAGVAGASWAGTTAWVGAESRDAYEALVRDLRAYAMGLEVVNAGYESGFLRSVATTEFRPAGKPEAEPLLRLRHVIEHSPVALGEAPRLGAARAVTTLDRSAFSEALRALLAGFGEADPVRLVTTVGLGGESVHELALAPYEHEIDGTRVASREGVWDVTVDEALRMVGTGRFGGLDVESAEGSLSVGAWEDRFDYRLQADGGWPEGRYEASLASVVQRVPALGTELAFEDVDVEATSSVEGERAGSAVRVDVARVDAPIEVDRMSLSFALEGLDAGAYERYAGLVYASPFLATSEAELAAMAPDAVLAEAEAVFGALLETVVPGTGLDLALTLGNAGGAAEASLSLGFAGDGSPSGRGSIRTVGDLLGALEASASVGADDAALALTPAAMLLDPAALAPWVERDGGRWTSEARLADLVLDVNGNELPLAMMLGEALDAPLAWPEAPAAD